MTGNTAIVRPIRGVAALMALLALLVAIAIPPGFMPGASAGSPLVICTGHGPLTLAGADGRHAPAKPARSDKHNQTCPFAGHDVAAPTFALGVVTAAAIDRRRPVDPAVTDLATGPGLAAPPPPSHAPRALL